MLSSSGLMIAALLILSPLHHGHRVAARVRHALGVAYRAFVDDFAKQSPARAPLAQAASPEGVAVIDDRLTDGDNFTA